MLKLRSKLLNKEGPCYSLSGPYPRGSQESRTTQLDTASNIFSSFKMPENTWWSLLRNKKSNENSLSIVLLDSNNKNEKALDRSSLPLFIQNNPK